MASPESVASGAYKFPKLPAAFAGFTPPSGTLFDYSAVLFAQYSTFQGYDNFLKEENLRMLLFKLKPGQNVELNLTGSQGKP